MTIEKWWFSIVMLVYQRVSLQLFKPSCAVLRYDVHKVLKCRWGLSDPVMLLPQMSLTLGLATTTFQRWQGGRDNIWNNHEQMNKPLWIRWKSKARGTLPRSHSSYMFLLHESAWNNLQGSRFGKLRSITHGVHKHPPLIEGDQKNSLYTNWHSNLAMDNSPVDDLKSAVDCQYQPSLRKCCTDWGAMAEGDAHPGEHQELGKATAFGQSPCRAQGHLALAHTFFGHHSTIFVASQSLILDDKTPSFLTINPSGFWTHH